MYILPEQSFLHPFIDKNTKLSGKEKKKFNELNEG